MEKSQSPAQQQQQQQQQQQIPFQFTADQFPQLQQIVNAYATGQPTIQVKQEYATQQQPQGISAADLKTLQDQHNQNMQQMQIVQAEAPQSPHQNSAQNALQQAVQAGQVPAEYLQAAQRIQVLPQTLQNSQYLTQQMYSPQLVMSGNLLTHSGLGQQPQIQLIAAGKQFQNQLTPQMLTTAGGKQVLAGAQGFSSYTIPSSQPQTLLFSPVTINGSLGNSQQQQNNQQQILNSMQAQNTPTKQEGQKTLGQKVVQKVGNQVNQSNQQAQANAQQNANNQQNNQQCVQVSQTMPTAQILSGQAMQFAMPWQGMTPFWATNGLQPQTLQLATNPIFIRGTNPDGTPVLFQQSPQPQATQQTVQSPHNQISLVGNITQTATAQKVRPATDAMQQKTQVQPRAPPILPQGAPIRPASGVNCSTQTAMNQNANLMAKAPKVRTKQTPVRPAAPNIKVINQQTGQQATMMQQVVTPTGVNKMVVMSNINGQLTPVLQQNTAQQNFNNDKLKAQQQQQVILQQAMANQQLQNLQQNAAQQQAIQQQIQQIQLQQHQLQLQSQAGIQNVQLLAAQSGMPQVILQSQQMPTVTSGVSLHQTLSQMTQSQQQGIMTKAGTHQILHMPASSQATVVSVPTSMTNAQIVTSIAGAVSSDTSNSILGPLSSPQTPLQPPQNPLIAMTTLSASPMSSIGMSTKVDTASGEHKILVSTSSANAMVTSSPLKQTQADDKKNAAKKQEEAKKLEESTSSAGKSQPSTPVKPQTTAPASNSPLATQNGEGDGKKTTTTPVSAPMLKNELPKAMVKPNVLTHVIEGYVIQESNEPFPVTRQRYSEKENDEPPKKKQAIEAEGKPCESPKVNGESSSSVSSSTPIQSPSDMVACEQCGKQEMRSKLRRKRFCSLNCARASKSSSTDASPVVSTNNNGDSSVAASPSQADKKEDTDAQLVEEHIMMKWSVAQVCDFIKNLPGCTDYAEDFALQEIDGQALLLLKENHLVSAMGMKLGPALKIVSKIESMRVSQDPEQGEGSSENQTP